MMTVWIVWPHVCVSPGVKHTVFMFLITISPNQRHCRRVKVCVNENMFVNIGTGYSCSDNSLSILGFSQCVPQCINPPMHRILVFVHLNCYGAECLKKNL